MQNHKDITCPGTSLDGRLICGERDMCGRFKKLGTKPPVLETKGNFYKYWDIFGCEDRTEIEEQK